MWWYEKINKVWSPRLHLLNLLKENDVFSEYPREWFVKIFDKLTWYYFSQELLDKNFALSECTSWKIWSDFMKITWYSRPKINSYIEKHWRIVYLSSWYYNFKNFRTFLNWHIKKWIENRWRKCKQK